MLDTETQPEAAPGLDFDLGLSEPAPAGGTPPAPESVAAPADVTADLGFDLDLGGGEENKAAAAPAEQPVAAAVAEAPDAISSIDFDFELPGSGATAESAPPSSAPAASAPEAPAAAGGIDFDFNLDLPPQKEEEPSPPLDLSAISLDLGTPGEVAPAQDAHWQEVATKLDLAKAYQEMGDKDGARELLNEVLKEGDAAQQQQAQTTLTALG